MYLLLFFLPLLSTVECRFAGSSSESLLFSSARGQQIRAFRYTDFISEFLVTDALFRNKETSPNVHFSVSCEKVAGE